jgi:hypothetical protein
MEEYRSNSDKSRENRNSNPTPDKKVEKIVNGTVTVKKKNGLQKITEMFTPNDIGSIQDYIIQDLLIPKAKDVILGAVEALLGVNGHSSSGSRTNASKVSYRKYYEDNQRRDSRDYQRNSHNNFNYDEIIFDSYGEADEVLTSMDEMIATYNIVSVADYYEMAGVSHDYTANKYGWTDIRSARIVRERNGGYSIKLPKAMVID